MQEQEVIDMIEPRISGKSINDWNQQKQQYHVVMSCLLMWQMLEINNQESLIIQTCLVCFENMICVVV